MSMSIMIDTKYSAFTLGTIHPGAFEVICSSEEEALKAINDVGRLETSFEVSQN